MKNLLIKPINIGDHIQPSLGLVYLATQIKKQHEVAIHDCIKNNTSIQDVNKVIEEIDPDVIGIQCYTFDVPNVYEMLKNIKQAFPSKITVLGGPHISALPYETFNQMQPYLDFGFRGEAEIGFPELLELLETKNNNYEKAEGLIWKDEAGEIQANDMAFKTDLDELGFPAWDLMPPETYPEAQHGAFFKKFPIAPIIITRGCPYSCAFCLAPIISGKTIRKHSVQYVQEHIKMLYERGIREIHIVDDNFTFDKEYCKQVLKGIIDLEIDISIAFPNGIRADKVDDEVMELMKKAGVYLVSIAVEAGTDRILKKMKKATTVEQIKENVARIRKHGLPVAGFFIIGYPGETREEIEETIKLSRQLGLIRANFFTFLPLPGTSSYYELVQENKKNEIDWKNFHFMTAPFVPEGMTRKELLALKRKAFIYFYLRPHILIQNVLSIKSFKHFIFLLKRFYHWILMGPSSKPH